MADVDTAGNPQRSTGLVLRDPLPWPEMREIAATAEHAGYSALFVPEIAAREAFSTLTGLAGATNRIELGTGVVTMWSRSPAITAMAAATLHDLSSGRFILGLGAGTPPPGSAEGRSPIQRLGAYVRTVRTILSGRPAPADDPLGADGFVMAPELTGRQPPIWVAALGDRMLRLAGEVADGVLLNWCTPERVATARSVLAASAERAGRDPGSITVAVYVRACLGVEERTALAVLRAATALYAAMPHYRRQFESMGFHREAAAAADAFQAGDVEGVPQSMVGALTVMGGRKEALDRFAAHHDAGADLVLCYPVAALDPFSSILGTLLAAAPDPAIES